MRYPSCQRLDWCSIWTVLCACPSGPRPPIWPPFHLSNFSLSLSLSSPLPSSQRPLLWAPAAGQRRSPPRGQLSTPPGHMWPLLHRACRHTPSAAADRWSLRRRLPFSVSSPPLRPPRLSSPLCPAVVALRIWCVWYREEVGGGGLRGGGRVRGTSASCGVRPTVGGRGGDGAVRRLSAVFAAASVSSIPSLFRGKGRGFAT